MMEYAKVILPAVSDWKELFRKELLKCLNWLDSDEEAAFYAWCNKRFSDIHKEILDEVFTGVASRQNNKGVLINMPNPAHQPMRETG